MQREKAIRPACKPNCPVNKIQEAVEQTIIISFMQNKKVFKVLFILSKFSYSF
jgi:hypothetical protein